MIKFKMKKRSFICIIILLFLFIPIIKAETSGSVIHSISIKKLEIGEVEIIDQIEGEIDQAEGELQERGSSVGVKTYYYGTGLIAKEENDELFYYHKDNLGSTRVVTNKDGDILEESNYLPYGENLGSSDETFGFTGKELDDSGLTYFGARYYDPSLGVFTTVDPIKDGMNHYAYANNNPMKYVDPTGLYADSNFIGPMPLWDDQPQSNIGVSISSTSSGAENFYTPGGMTDKAGDSGVGASFSGRFGMQRTKGPWAAEGGVNFEGSLNREIRDNIPGGEVFSYATTSGSEASVDVGVKLLLGGKGNTPSEFSLGVNEVIYGAGQAHETVKADIPGVGPVSASGEIHNEKSWLREGSATLTFPGLGGSNSLTAGLSNRDKYNQQSISASHTRPLQRGSVTLGWTGSNIVPNRGDSQFRNQIFASTQGPTLGGLIIGVGGSYGFGGSGASDSWSSYLKLSRRF